MEKVRGPSVCAELSGRVSLCIVVFPPRRFTLWRLHFISGAAGQGESHLIRQRLINQGMGPFYAALQRVANCGCISPGEGSESDTSYFCSEQAAILLT